MNNDPQQYTPPTQPQQPAPNPYGQQPPVYAQPVYAPQPQQVAQPVVPAPYIDRKFPVWGYAILVVVVLGAIGLLMSTFIFM